ncbi:hypothetical protein [Acidovorax sp. M2(2025)]|uniref:hypothetical protein n=1 Tax=Acidovorax sp. M2(2025) TaxID=3411355 RepID=UPI003BF5C0A0
MMTDPSSLIAAPRVGDVVLRPFLGAADFSSMASVPSASFAADGVLALRTASHVVAGIPSSSAWVVHGAGGAWPAL